MKRIIIPFLIAVSTCCANNGNRAHEELQNHYVRTAQYWDERVSTHAGLEDKIVMADAQMLDYLKKDNTANGISSTPKAPQMDDKWIPDVRSALLELPQRLRDSLNQCAAGIVFVKDLFGTGFAEMVDKERKPVRGFFVFDYEVLQKKANEWVSWKDSSPFSDGAVVKGVIQPAERNDRIHAFQYIFLHEMGHLFSVCRNVMPDWEKDLSAEGEWGKYPFLHFSWHPPINGTIPHLFQEQAGDLAKVRYYTDHGLDSTWPKKLYEQLGKTNFPTLYSTTNVYEDFADSFANYVHVVILNNPYELTVAGKMVVGHCWKDSRCQEKKNFFSTLLGK